MSESPGYRTTARLKLLLILAIAVGPIVLAYVFYFYFRDMAPAGTMNEGHLVQPPLQVEDIAAKPGKEIPLGEWGMLILTGPDCDQNCEQLLYLSRQVHRGLGKESDRVKRFLLVGGRQISPGFEELIQTEHPGLDVRYHEPTSLQEVFESTVESPLEGNYLFLMDPNGNIMMYYTHDLAGKPMLSDLKHLLKISGIG